MVPFLDLDRMHAGLRDEFSAAFTRVLNEGRFIMGPDVGALEARLSDFLGVNHAVGVSSGSDALVTALMALDVGPGDEVLVPSCTFFATAGAVTRVGATPVFVDVEPNTLLMSVDAALARCTSRTRAVIPVHLYGQCASIEGYADAGLFVVEDAAQSLGATDANGKSSGAAGDVGCFSFFPTKPLGGFGDGGMVVTNNDELADSLRKIRVHGAQPKFHHEMIGGNFRLDTLQAAILLEKVPYLEQWTTQRQKLAASYRQAFCDLSNITVLDEVRGEHVYHQFVIRSAHRDELRQYLTSVGIGTGIYYPEPLHMQPCFSSLGYTEGSLPHTEAACREVIALPCFAGLTDDEQHQVISAVIQFSTNKNQ